VVEVFGVHAPRRQSSTTFRSVPHCPPTSLPPGSPEFASVPRSFGLTDQSCVSPVAPGERQTLRTESRGTRPPPDPPPPVRRVSCQAAGSTSARRARPRRTPAPDQRRERSPKGNEGLCSKGQSGQPLPQLIDQQILKGYRSYLASRKEDGIDGSVAVAPRCPPPPLNRYD
jgi:hypothetical protein